MGLLPDQAPEATQAVALVADQFRVALLPLVISLGQEELTSIAASVAGGLICAYQVGYGIAAFGVGPLLTRAGLRLDTIYGDTAAVALAMSLLSFALVRHRRRA